MESSQHIHYCKAELAQTDYLILPPKHVPRIDYARNSHGSGIDVCLQDLVSEKIPQYSSHISIYLRGYGCVITPYLNGILSIRSTELKTVPLEKLKEITDRALHENGLINEICNAKVSDINLCNIGVYEYVFPDKKSIHEKVLDVLGGF